MTYDTSLGWVDFNYKIHQTINHLLYELTSVPISKVTEGDIGVIRWLDRFNTSHHRQYHFDRYLFGIEIDDFIHDFLMFNHLLDVDEQAYFPSPDQTKLDHYLSILVERSFRYLDSILRESPTNVKLRFHSLSKDVLKFIKELQTYQTVPDIALFELYETRVLEFNHQLLKHKMIQTPGIKMKYNY